MALGKDFIAAQIAKYIGSQEVLGVDDGELVKVTPGTRGATLTAGTQPTETTHACKLLVASYDDHQLQGTGIRASDREIHIYGGTLPDGVVPAADDKIVADGITFRIVPEREGGRGVQRDPVGAVYRCHART